MQTALPGALADAPRTASVIPAEIAVTGSSVAAAPERDRTIATIDGPRSYEATKRAIDIVLGFIGLVFTGLASLIVVPLILSSSKGNPVFAQTRVGKGGKRFTCYKFRTMHSDAEARKRELAHLNEADGPVFKIAEDPRHVRELRWLRRFSIDEMPQFWNVIRGEMSLVGPRPPIPDEVELYTTRQLGRLSVKPGMTCTWQVNGRSDVSFEHWVEMDLDYISRRTTRLDLMLIVKTIPAVLSGRGAS